MLLALVLPAQALAFGIGYRPWYAEPQGVIQSQGRELDLREDLNLEASYSGGWVIETNLLELSFTPLDYASTATLEEAADFGPNSFAAGTEVETRTEIDDLAARYLWRPWPALGIGVTAKWLDALVMVSEVTDEEDDGGGGGLLGGLLGGGEPVSETRTFSELFPMLSVAAALPLMELFSLEAEGAYIRYEDDEVLEYSLAIAVRGEFVGLSLGWQEKRYDVRDQDFRLDARVNGLLAQLDYYF